MQVEDTLDEGSFVSMVNHGDGLWSADAMSGEPIFRFAPGVSGDSAEASINGKSISDFEIVNFAEVDAEVDELPDIKAPFLTNIDLVDLLMGVSMCVIVSPGKIIRPLLGYIDGEIGYFSEPEKWSYLNEAAVSRLFAGDGSGFALPSVNWARLPAMPQVGAAATHEGGVVVGSWGEPVIVSVDFNDGEFDLYDIVCYSDRVW